MEPEPKALDPLSIQDDNVHVFMGGMDPDGTRGAMHVCVDLPDCELHLRKDISLPDGNACAENGETQSILSVMRTETREMLRKYAALLPVALSDVRNRLGPAREGNVLSITCKAGREIVLQPWIDGNENLVVGMDDGSRLELGHEPRTGRYSAAWIQQSKYDDSDEICEALTTDSKSEMETWLSDLLCRIPPKME